MKATAYGFIETGTGLATVAVVFENGTGIVDSEQLNVDISSVPGNVAGRRAAANAVIAAYAATQSYGIGASDVVWQTDGPLPARTTSTLSLSLVGTGATGTQISAIKDSSVRLSVSTSATATIAGAAVSTVVLKKCATNSSTEANWTTVGTAETSQSYSLAVALQGVTGAKQQLVADIPAGWYVKLVNSGSGTHSESFLSGEQTIYG